MADKIETPEHDFDDNIFDEGAMEDDGTADVIRAVLDKQMQDADDKDDGGFDQPFEAKADEAPDVVSSDKGRDLLDDAEMAKAKGKREDTDFPDQADEKTDKAPDAPADGDKAKEAEETTDAAKAEGDDKPASLEAADLTSLLDGVPDDRKSEISRRLGAAERLLAPFKNHQAELQHHGQTPEGAVSRLLELNTFAQTKPDEYLAWVATQTNSEPHKALEGAAKLLGYKVVKDGDDDDDMFEDPAAKALKEENTRLKAQLQGNRPGFGPDTPERQQARTVQQQLADFTAETDESGQLKRPLFNQLHPQIAAKAAAHRQQTQRAVTPDDLQRFYDEASADMRSAFGMAPEPAPQPAPQPQDGSAAQPTPTVADQLQQKAAAAQRARKASKSIDGTGQGASRRPALSDNASIEDVIRHFAD